MQYRRQYSAHRVDFCLPRGFNVSSICGGYTDLKIDKEKYREVLLQVRSQILGDNRQMAHEALDGMGKEGSGDLSRAPIHLADQASDTQEQEFMLERVTVSSDTLADIDAALDRLEDGSYGTCEDCGAEIGERRLKIKPWASMCVDCRRKEERG
jgi:DnaK suppressor protein